MGKGSQGSTLTEEQKALLAKTTLQIFLNMAACHMKVEQFEKVVDDCTKVTQHAFACAVAAPFSTHPALL